MVHGRRPGAREPGDRHGGRRCGIGQRSPARAARGDRAARGTRHRRRTSARPGAAARDRAVGRPHRRVLGFHDLRVRPDRGVGAAPRIHAAARRGGSRRRECAAPRRAHGQGDPVAFQDGPARRCRRRRRPRQGVRRPQGAGSDRRLHRPARCRRCGGDHGVAVAGLPRAHRPGCRRDDPPVLAQGEGSRSEHVPRREARR